MQHDPFSSFVAFVKADQQAVSLKKTLDLINRQEHEAQDRLSTLQQQYDEHKKRHYDSAKACDALELEIRTLRERLQGAKQRQVLAHTPKEFQAATNEIQSLETLIDKQEDLLLIADDSKKDFAKITETAAQLVADQRVATESTLQEVRHGRNIVFHQYEEVLRVRDDLSGQVNPDMLKEFIARKGQVENPAVFVQGDICTGCFNVLSSVEKNKLKKHILTSCGYCYRLLLPVEDKA